MTRQKLVRVPKVIINKHFYNSTYKISGIRNSGTVPRNEPKKRNQKGQTGRSVKSPLCSTTNECDNPPRESRKAVSSKKMILRDDGSGDE
jgi:hypothetical protein